MLMTKLHLAGFLDKDRAGVGKIESQLIYVNDYELHYFARVLDVKVLDLLPELSPQVRVDDQLTNLMKLKNNHHSTRRPEKLRRPSK